MLSRLLFCLLVLLPVGLRAQGFVDVFDDAGLTQRAGTMTDPAKTLYVRILAEHLSPPGFSSLEFRLSGLQDLVVSSPTWTAAPAVVIGTLPEGVDVGWPSCQHDESLLSFTVFSLSPPQDREIRVAAHTNPSNPNFPIPYLSPCDGPCFCTVIVEGDAYVLNPTVAVQTTNWGRIKGLYQ